MKAYFLSPENGRKDECDRKRFEQWFAGQGIRYENGEQSGHLSIGPLRYVAMMAGLGIIRKNNFFYTVNPLKCVSFWTTFGKGRIPPQLLPERILTLPDDYLIKNVIPKTADHMQPSDVPVLRRNAERALRFHEKR